MIRETKRDGRGEVMNEWMKKLAGHHKKMRTAHPKEDLMVVFDIDDTILDLRHMIVHVLRSFDRRHGTRHFEPLTTGDIHLTERAIDEILEVLKVPKSDAHRASDWFRRRSWSSTVTRNGHRPFPGAMDVVHHLQTQPRTFVSLNTGRPESIRHETLHCLNDLGRPYGVGFDDSLLYMNRYGWGLHISESKIDGMAHFRNLGYRIIAFVDNEPENLEAIHRWDTSRDIMLLHADTVFSGLKTRLPKTAISGRAYDVSALRESNHQPDEFGKAA
jgi:hypothetical protein